VTASRFEPGLRRRSGTGWTWSAADLCLLRELYPHHPTAEVAARLGRRLAAVYERAARLGLRKTPEYLASPAAHRTNGRKGIGTRFQPGHATWNKGTHYVAGGRSAETRFPKGALSGRARQLLQPVGAYRINADGCLDRKVRADGPPQRRWQPVHRLVWIEAHGLVPADHVVCFLPGRRTTVLEEITLDAIELVHRRDLMKRNSVHRLPKPLAQLVQLRGALNRKINARLRARDQENGHQEQDQ
jgi:hypothetical protein